METASQPDDQSETPGPTAAPLPPPPPSASYSPANSTPFGQIATLETLVAQTFTPFQVISRAFSGLLALVGLVVVTLWAMQRPGMDTAGRQLLLAALVLVLSAAPFSAASGIARLRTWRSYADKDLSKTPTALQTAPLASGWRLRASASIISSPAPLLVSIGFYRYVITPNMRGQITPALIVVMGSLSSLALLLFPALQLRRRSRIGAASSSRPLHQELHR